MPRDRGPFRNGERVLVPHTDKYYEAKILKTERRDDMWYYLIHYAVSPAFHARYCNRAIWPTKCAEEVFM